MTDRIKAFVFILLFFFCSLLSAQVKIASWNLQNFGRTKSEAEMAFIASCLKDFDVVALQEVVAGYGGAQAVARLSDALNRTGGHWDYSISEPTSSTPYATERYAYLWQPSRVRASTGGRLAKEFVQKMDREPYMMEFETDTGKFTLVSFHAIPAGKQPETEIKYFKFFPETYPDRRLVFLGDFNLPQDHTVFNPLKQMGYLPALRGQKTSMKMRCNKKTCLASEFDNLFYNAAQVALLESGVLHFYRSFPDMVKARRISDHIPIWVSLDL